MPEPADPPALARADVTGIVLAGGLGRRMGGVDKGLVMLEGRAMVAHVLDRLAPQVGAIVVNANQNRERYAAFGHPVVADAVGGFAGPLAGLHAGMTAASTPFVVTVPCDSPFLPLDLVARLARAVLAADADLGVARTFDQPHPVFALVRRDVLPQPRRVPRLGRAQDRRLVRRAARRRGRLRRLRGRLPQHQHARRAGGRLAAEVAMRRRPRMPPRPALPRRAVVAWPAGLPAAVEAYRRTHDPLAPVLPAHVTFVFPFATSLSVEQLHAHVRRATARWPVIPVALDGPGAYGAQWVHLRVTHGRDAIVELHDRLYRRALAPFLRREFDYEPHVTIGRARDLPACEAMLDAARAAFPRPLEVVLRSLAIVTLLDHGEVRVEREIALDA